MDGVILFVDDKVHDCFVQDNDLKRTPENELFESLRQDYPVLGVKDLDLADRAIKSIGSFTVIILDWVFDEREELLSRGEEREEIKYIRQGSVQDERALRFLETNDFYSLVYVYSNESVEEKYGDRLKARFGERIQFQKKPLENPAEAITAKIRDWQEQNKNLAVPLAWTATINQSIQKIFKELAEADVNWLRDIAESAKEDGINEALFIIDIFQYLLAENNIQNAELRKQITDYLRSQPEANAAPTNEESIAKLFNRLFYTRISSEIPIMTGDICQINEQRYGIIISPECDMRRILKETGTFEMLVFEKNGFDKYIENQFQGFKREEYLAWEGGNQSKKGKLENLRKLFNQTEPRFHILPSFPMLDSLNQSVVIEFSLGRELHTSEQVREYEREYKLNSPFIQQLRQRYLSYLGRIGVPSLPSILRNFNLK